MGLTDEEVDYLAKKDFICVTQLEICNYRGS